MVNKSKEHFYENIQKGIGDIMGETWKWNRKH